MSSQKSDSKSMSPRWDAKGSTTTTTTSSTTAASTNQSSAPQPSARAAIAEAKDSQGTSRVSARASARVGEQPDSKEAQGTSRVSARESARDGPAAVETFRSTMSTTRVQIALSALTAEKEALKAKLAFIDQQLESDNKKKVSKTKK